MDREAAPGLIEFRGRAVTRLLELLPRLKKVALLLPPESTAECPIMLRESRNQGGFAQRNSRRKRRFSPD